MTVAFALVLSRVLGLLLGMPVFSRLGLPVRARVMLAAALSFALVPLAGVPALASEAYALAGALVRELALGFSMGMFARMLLGSFHLAAALMSFQAGFALSSAFNPESGESTTALDSLHMNLAATLFLLVDGHHMLIRVLAGSFETFPLGGSFAFATLAEPLFASAGEMFESGARIAAPVTGLLLLVNASIGLLNRVMPHLSIFNVGFPLTVMAGMLAVLASLPRAANFFLSAYQILEHNLADLFLG